MSSRPDLRLRFFRLSFAACACLVTLAACGTNDPGADPTCVDFSIGSDDLSCNVASDCTFVGALHLCPHDPSCGPENPVNVTGQARYAQATSSVPVTQVECGAPAPVGCVHHVCQVLSPDSDAGGDAARE